MATPSAGPETSVRLRRTFAASPDKVFQAWTDPKVMTKWFARGTEKNTVNVVEADVRVGGKYRVEVQSPEGKTYRISGTYREVQPPEKLVFTWSWEEVQESLVTLEFRKLGQSSFTEVVLNHEMLPKKWRDDHEKGWKACFDLLERTLS